MQFIQTDTELLNLANIIRIFNNEKENSVTIVMLDGTNAVYKGTAGEAIWSHFSADAEKIQFPNDSR